MPTGIYKRQKDKSYGMKGKHHSEKTRILISKNNARIWSGKKRPLETILKIAKANTKPIEDRIMRKCLICGKIFFGILCDYKFGKGKYCSKRCVGLAKTLKFTKEFICIVCDNKFRIKLHEVSKRNNDYCSMECKLKHSREKRKCLYCKEEFTVSINSSKKFCSKICAYKYQYPNFVGGKVKVNCEVCNKEIIRYKRLVKKHKVNFCSGICQHKWLGIYMLGLLKGKKHPNWKGGTSRETYASGWTKTLRQSIRERDSYKCQLCGAPQEEFSELLIVHHIDYDKSNHSPKNLLTLCRRCHNKTNVKQDYWKDYFNKRRSNELQIASAIEP